MVELKGYRVTSIDYDNKIAGGTQLKLQNQVRYNMNYFDSENRCQGVLNFRITDADLKPIEIKVELVGDFVYQDGDDKADIHADSFDQLFPFLRQIVNSITSMSNMPLLIPVIHLDRNSIQINEAKKPSNESLN